jgi:hypothetical protein
MFSVDRGRRDGLYAWCKACTKAWAAANRERKADKEKAWRESNRERVSAQAKSWRIANRGRHAANGKAWAAANPEAVQAKKAKRRARKLAAEGSYSAADVKQLRAEQNDRCAFCRSALGGKGHVDHVQPLAKGGSNGPDNLQLLCRTCNLSKGAKDPVQHITALGLIGRDEATFLTALPLAERIAFVKTLAL